MESQSDKRYTYADYASWETKERYELIDGVPHMMAPAPSTEHQRVLRRLFTRLANHLEGKRCEVFSAPFDVRLNPETKDDTVVQPDITVICDPGKIDAKGCRGVPDMIIEIQSPSTARLDQITKLNRYRDAGVMEYWIVNPDLQSVQAYLLRDGNYYVHAYGAADTVPVGTLAGLPIPLCDLFTEPDETT